MGIGDWGLGIGPNPQSPIPNPQSPNIYLNLRIIILYNVLYINIFDSNIIFVNIWSSKLYIIIFNINNINNIIIQKQ